MNTPDASLVLAINACDHKGHADSKSLQYYPIPSASVIQIQIPCLYCPCKCVLKRANVRAQAEDVKVLELIAFSVWL